MTTSVHQSARVNPELHVLLLLALFYGFTAIYIPKGGEDIGFWIQWALYIQEHGIAHIYDLYTHPVPGQPPSFLYGPYFMYVLYFFERWQGSVGQILENIHKLKFIVLVFDMVGIWYALRFVRTEANRPFYALFLIFNIGLLYNTITWGQIDSTITCFTLMAVYYALRGRVAWSAVWFVIAFMIKPQPIVFLPILMLLWWPTIVRQPLRTTLVGLLGVGFSVFIPMIPFIQAGTVIDYLAMLKASLDIYPVVSVNAGNVWNFLLEGNLNTRSDKLVWFGMNYKHWGLLMFAVSYLVILFPMIRQFFQIGRGQRTQYDTSTILLISGLAPIAFYFFNTQMHERYAHPSVLMLAAYAFSSGDFVPYVIASVGNFVVMEKHLRLFIIRRIGDLISLEQVAMIFSVVLVWGVVQLYRQKPAIRTETAVT
ncbi:glycosyltransferase 87 family protein [Spirosoma koreense]